MRQEATNTFIEGLNMDLNPLTTPNNVLTDCLNGTVITYNGNEFVLQNDQGNYKLENCKLKRNFIPVGIKGYGDILYIVSYNPLTKETEIGSYPSPQHIFSTNDRDYSIDLHPSIPNLRTVEGGNEIEHTNTYNYNQTVHDKVTGAFVFGETPLNWPTWKSDWGHINTESNTTEFNEANGFRINGFERTYKHKDGTITYNDALWNDGIDIDANSTSGSGSQQDLIDPFAPYDMFLPRYQRYTEIAKAEELGLFAIGDDMELYKINPGDEIKFVPWNKTYQKDEKPWFPYQDLNKYILSEIKKLVDIPQNKDFWTSVRSDFEKVYWQVPGWLAARW